MKEQEALMINGVLIQDHHISDYDDWGLGQLGISTIEAMIVEGRKVGLDFCLYKEVTAYNDELDVYQTIHAGEDYLFVFPSDNRDLSEFWRNVEKAENRNSDDSIPSLGDMLSKFLGDKKPEEI